MSALPPLDLLLVTTTPNPSVAEADFNTWYDEVHIPEIRSRVAGIESVERYRAADADPARFLALYRTSRPASEVLADLRAADLSDSTAMLDISGNAPTITAFNALL